jgi:translocation and assembly module TamB
LIGQFHVERLAIEDLEVVLPPGQGSDAEVDFPQLVVPAALVVKDLTVSGLVVRQGGQSYPLVRVSAALRGEDQQFSIERIEIEANDFELALVGNIRSNPQLDHVLRTDWSLRLPSGDRLSGVGTLEGNLLRTAVRQRLLSPTPVILNGSIQDLNRSPTWQAQVKVEGFRHSDWRYPLPPLAGELSFDATGDLATATVKGLGKVVQPDTGPVSAEYHLKAHSSQRLEVFSLQLDAERAPVHVDARGEWRAGGEYGDVDLQLKWQGLRWPLQGEAYFLSQQGQGHFSGNPGAYRFQLETGNPFSGLPPSRWSAKGRGNLQQAQFDTLHIKTLDGDISASGSIDWRDKVSWQADIKTSNINPQSLYPDWPGRLNAVVQTRGGITDGRPHSDIHISHLDGILRQYPVSLVSDLNWQQTATGDHFDLQRIEFSSGGSTLRLSGQAGDKLALSWALRSADLGELVPQMQGKLSATGTLQGALQQPRVDAIIDGAALAYADYRAAALKGSFSLDALDLQHLQVDLEARSVMLGTQEIGQIAVSGDSRKLDIKAVAGDYRIDLGLAGVAKDDRWSGQVERATITLGALDQWLLTEPMALNLDRQSLRLERGCWADADQVARVCVELQGKEHRWRSDLSLNGLSPRYLQRWIPADLKIDAVANATARLEYFDNRLTGSLGVELPKGKVQYLLPDGEQEQWGYDSGELEVVADAQGVRSSARFTLENDGLLNTAIDLPGADLLALNVPRQVIRGNLRLAFDDLGFVGLWLPEAHQVKGRLNVNLTVGGRLPAPTIDGRITLADGSFLVPRLGLDVREVEISGQSDGLERLSYSIRAKSGEGRVEAKGVFRPDERTGWATDLTVQGRNLQVARIPEAQVEVSPDLTIHVEPYRVEVNGLVDVPYAHIEPRDVSSAVRLSDDVVVLGETQVQENSWKIISRVRVNLGDKVHFFGFGFEGRLTGGVLVEESPGQPTRGTGGIGVEDGRYRAYGQRLDVTQGRLVFSGGPLMTPGLDVRAERKINSITVGVQALGTLDQPRIELFSSPAMGETDILSYLILGRPVENASSEEGQTMAKAALALGLTGGDRLARNLRERFGLDEMRLDSASSGDQASLVLGRYLTPRLYVSYGIGLIEAFNTVIVRYQISERWQLEAESGESYGADLVFTIDR